MPAPQSFPRDETAADGPAGDRDLFPRRNTRKVAGNSRLSVQPDVDGPLPSVVELRLAGELDGDTSAELREKLSVFAARSSGGLLVLNLSGITFCDSVSLYTLLAIRQALPLAGIEVRLAEPSAVTRAAAKRVGLTADLALPDDPEQVPPHRSPRL